MKTEPNGDWLKLDGLDKLNRAELTKEINRLYQKIQEHKSSFSFFDVIKLNDYVTNCCKKVRLSKNDIILDEDDRYNLLTQVLQISQYKLFYNYAVDLKEYLRSKSKFEFKKNDLGKNELAKITYLKNCLKIKKVQLPEKCSFLLTQKEYQKLLTKIE